MNENTNNENSLNEMSMKICENEIRDLKRFWRDLEWYERESVIIDTIESAELVPMPIIRDTEIPEDLKIRSSAAIENLNTLKALNDNEKPSNILLKIKSIRTKLGLLSDEEKEDTGPNLRMCIAAISHLSNNDKARLDKYLGIQDIVKNGRAHSYSYQEIYYILFSEPFYTSSAMFIVFSKYIGNHVHFQ